MSYFIFTEYYIIVKPTFEQVSVHKHPFLHVFLSQTECNIKVDKEVIQGQCICVASDTKHMLPKGHNCDLMLLIDSSSTIAEQINEICLKGKAYDVIGDISCDSDSLVVNESVANLLKNIGVTNQNTRQIDKRIAELSRHLREKEYFSKSIKELAEVLYLSESRLTHLFKTEMGVSLKTYLLMRKLEYAYQLVVEGKQATYASLEAGFSSSAHLAYMCKKYTGISISEVMKNSR